MKTNVHFNEVSYLKLLSKLLLIAAFSIPCLTLRSQESSLTVYPTFGLSVGFFYPSDVNDYIESSLGSSYTTEYGSEDIFMYLELQGGIAFRMNRIDISGFLEYAFAPKWIVVTQGDNITFNFSRLSPGVNANYYIPIGTGKHSMFVGGGVQYNIMDFEEFHASSPGFKIQGGISLQFGKFNIQPYAAFKYAKATDSSDRVWGDFDLNYTGGQIGLLMSLHPAIDNK